MFYRIFTFAIVFSTLLTACQTNTPHGETSAAMSVPADGVNEDTLSMAARCNRHTQKYVFADKEMFDRCAAVTMTRKDGKPIAALPKALASELDCISATFHFFGDRYLTYTDAQSVQLYDMDSGKSLPLFTAFAGTQTNCMGVSPDGTKLLFVSVFYDDEMRAKSDYTTATRIIILDFDAQKFAVTNKQKFDRPVNWVASEGSMIMPKDCIWLDNKTVRFREYKVDKENVATNDGKFVDIAL